MLSAVTYTHSQVTHLVVQMVQQTHANQVTIEALRSNFCDGSLGALHESTSLKDECQWHADNDRDEGGVCVN